MTATPQTFTCCQCGQRFELASPDDPQIVCLACPPGYVFPDQSDEEREFSRRFLAHTRAEMAFMADVEEALEKQRAALLIHGGTSAPSKSAMFLPQPTLTAEEQAELRASSQEAMALFRSLRGSTDRT